MKANKFQKALILVRSLSITIAFSMKVILLLLFKKGTRANFDKVNHDWSSHLLQIVKLTVSIHNLNSLEYKPGKRYIIISNHSSHYDIPLILGTLPGSIRMMAKKELFKVPIWGHAMQIADFISIDRENPRQAVLDLQNAKEKMSSGIIVWVAPEGSRSRTGELQEFKKGAFLLALKTNAIIIPIAIKNSHRILPPKTLDFHIREHVDMYVCNPIETEKYTARDIPALMQDAKNVLESVLK